MRWDSFLNQLNALFLRKLFNAMANLYRILFIVLSLIWLPVTSGADNPPKRELRAVWVATVMNIDWPSKQGLDADAQMQEIDKLLDKHKALGMNAIILQVRSASDAIYPSGLAPWSRYLTGTQGAAPDPFYDPLEYYIEACHLRGLEFHAWFNPYRVKQNLEEELDAGHVLHQHPEWGWEYNNRLYMDPGNPEVRDYLKQVVLEVVNRYDIDAVHFDDYFYPYPIVGMQLPDSLSFSRYAGHFKSEEIDDWRRENVNRFIHELSIEIKQVKPWVKFGVSPFGVWRNSDVDPKGSKTQAGITNYDHIYADVLKWQQEHWVDYMMPQLYWHRGHPAADFLELCEWWAENSYGREMYVGHGVYRLNERSGRAAWKNPSELPAQIRTVRNNLKLNGSAWFSSRQFDQNILGFKDSLTTKLYEHPALIPEMPWLGGEKPGAPYNLKVERIKKKGRILSWEAATDGVNEMDKARFFVVYRVPVGQAFDKNESVNIIDVIRQKEYPLKSRFFLAKKEKFIYYVSALNRLYSESDLSDPIQINE